MSIREVNFLQGLHTSTKRDYYARMNKDKPHCMKIAKEYNRDYWDGDRKYGFGGYQFDGRWQPIADKIIEAYDLKANDKVLDVGCGKGYLLWELSRYRLDCHGTDISDYALKEVRDPCKVRRANCVWQPYGNHSMDFVYSINVLHNLGYGELKDAIQEITRIGREKMYICVESFRNDEEQCNLQAWALTCKSFYSPDDWKAILHDNGYSGDLEYIFFE